MAKAKSIFIQYVTINFTLKRCAVPKLVLLQERKAHYQTIEEIAIKIPVLPTIAIEPRIWHCLAIDM